MPTKKPEGSARLDFISLMMPSDFRLPAILKFIRILIRRARYGGVSTRQQWFRLFADDVADLSTLPIGLLDMKAMALPRRLVPTTEAALRDFCRRLIDRGEDEEHIDVMLVRWPTDWTLDRHVAALWNIREHDLVIYEEIVRGRAGRALNRLKGRKKVGGMSEGTVQNIIARHLLLWCAMDVQMVTARARLSFVAPMGPQRSLLTWTMRTLKPGTILRIMRQTHRSMVRHFEEFLVDEAPRRTKPEGRDAKLIHHHAERHIKSHSKTWRQYLLELRESIPLIHRSSETMRDDIDRLAAYGTEMLPPRVEKDGSLTRRDNTLRQFHAMWFDDLSPAAGMTVALFRYVMAERHLDQLVGYAAAPNAGLNRRLYEIDSLPALPKDKRELAGVIDRVMDLAYSSRRVHLRDPDWRSKSLSDRKAIKATLQADPTLNQRDPFARAGYTFVGDALKFLQDMGQRERDASSPRHSHDHRHSTYWMMDVVPDRRLAR